MTTDHYILAACGLAFLAAVAYAMWPARSRALMTSIGESLKPVEAAAASTLGGLVKSLDSQALDQGAAELERQIVATLAQAHKARLQSALAPKDVTTAAPPSSS